MDQVAILQEDKDRLAREMAGYIAKDKNKVLQLLSTSKYCIVLKYAA